MQWGVCCGCAWIGGATVNRHTPEGDFGTVLTTKLLILHELERQKEREEEV